MRMIPLSSSSRSASSLTLGMSRVMSSGPVGVPGLDLELLDVDRCVAVVAHQAFVDQDRILEVVAAPGHEGHEDVAPEGQVALVGAGPVADDLADGHLVPLDDHRLLVDAGVLVGAPELGQVVDVGGVLPVADRAAALDLDDDPRGVDVIDHPRAAADDHRPRIPGGDPLHPRADQRGLGTEEGHRLALHVRPHQGAVGVVMLEEGDQRGGDAHQLLGRDVDEVQLFRGHQPELPPAAGIDPIAGEPPPGIEGGVGLGDGVLVLLPGGEVEGVRLAARQLHLALAHLLVGPLVLLGAATSPRR